jgi:nitrate/nitrite-specific signal transduction histidine kinase
MGSRIRHGGLRAKIIAWFLVPTTVILGVVALFTFYTYQRVTEELVLDRNREMTDVLSDALAAEFLEVYTRQLSDLWINPERDGDASPAREYSLQGPAGPLAAFDGGVVVLDAAGMVVDADPRRPDAVGQDWSAYPFVRQMMASAGGPILSDILPAGPQGDDVVTLALPLPDRQGALVGIFSLTAGTIENGLLRSANRVLGGLIREGRGVYLVDGDGRVLYAGGSADVQVGEDRAGEGAVQRVVAGETDSYRTRTLDGMQIVASFAPLSPPAVPPSESRQPDHRAEASPSKGRGLAAMAPEGSIGPAKAAYVPGGGMVHTTWGLVIEESWEVMMRNSRQYGRWLLLLLAAGVLVPAVVIAVGARQVTSPIMKLTGAAQKMAEGELDQTIAVRTGDELERLAEGFNHMSAQLRASYATLEKRVADRTRELTTLNAIAGVVSRSLDLAEVLQAALDKTLEAVGMAAGAAYRLEEDGETPVLIAHRGLSEALVSHLTRVSPWTGGVLRATGPLVRAVADTPEGPLKTLLETEGLRMEVSVPLMAKGRPLGVIYFGSRSVRAVTPEELSLLAAIGQQTGVAVENARLYEQAEESATAAERNRLARELHDAVTQTLFSASLIAAVLPEVWEGDQEEGRQLLQELRQLSRGALAEMRTLLLELRPAALAQADLGDLLRQLADAVTGQKGIPVDVTVEGEVGEGMEDPGSELPAEVRVALYRIAQEALNNVVKHAQAGRVSVSLCYAPGDEEVELGICDDGRGFDPTDIPPDHLGVGIMHERAEAIGAVLMIESRPGEGTRVSVTWTANDR